MAMGIVAYTVVVTMGGHYVEAWWLSDKVSVPCHRNVAGSNSTL